MHNTDVNSLRGLRPVLKRLSKGQLDQKDLRLVQQAISFGRITLASDGGLAIGGDATDNIFVTLTAEALEMLCRPALNPHEIPHPPADFTGRNAEVNELLEHFERGAIIVGMRGLGGIGKTVLAYKLAEKLQDRYPYGQLMVNLQGTDANPMKPTEAMANIIRSFDRTSPLPESEPDLARLYQSILHGKRILLLLDNAVDDRQVRPLLPPPTCGVLITSRNKFTLPGMKEIDLDKLKPSDAKSLLLAIAKRIGDNADELARLCGYLPLALRATGSLLANTPDLDPVQYIRELRAERTRLENLGSDGVDLDVDASFNLSYRKLSVNAARVFRTLAIFPADFDAKAEVIVSEDEGHRNLSELVRWSLVEFQNGTGRYRLQDLARVFAADLLEEEDDKMTRVSAHQRHAEHYRNVLSAANDLYLQGDKSITEGLRLFDQEWANIQAGQEWAGSMARRQIDHTETGKTSPEFLYGLHLSISYPCAGMSLLSPRLLPHKQIQWLEIALEAARLLKNRRREMVFTGSLGHAYRDLGEYKKAIKLYRKALAISREIGNRQNDSTALGGLGISYYALGEYQKAIEFYEKQLDVAREIGDRRGEGSALNSLGLAYDRLGEYRKAIEFHEKHLDIAKETGDRLGEGAAFGNLGLVYDDLGEHYKAIEFHEKQLAIAKEIGVRQSKGNALGNLGLAYDSLGEYLKAIEYYEKSLSIDREIENREGEGATLANLGLAYFNLGEYSKSIEFSKKALTVSREIGFRHGEGCALDNIGLAYCGLEEYRKAIGYHKQSLDISRKIGDRWGEGAVLANLGLAYCKLSEYPKAIEFYGNLLKFPRI